MPSRNTIRNDIDDGYYHVYGRGLSRMKIFRDDEDNRVFLNMLKRYLGKKIERDIQNRPYPNYHGRAELMAFCLMSNHFHLLIWQKDAGTISELMKSLIGSYSHFFNRKYHRSGALLESRFKASLILDDDYLLHLSRYIHLNPQDYRRWPWSSLPYYIDNWQADWLIPRRVLDLINSSYREFVEDYKDLHDTLEELKTNYVSSGMW
jgi:putative transposase